MKDSIDEFVKLEETIAEEKGDFVLFALFLREDAFDKWDLVIAAPWANANDKPVYDYIAEMLRNHLDRKTMLLLSRIVVIDTENSFLDEILSVIDVRHQKVEMKNAEFFNFKIEHAYIITANRDYEIANGA